MAQYTCRHVWSTTSWASFQIYNFSCSNFFVTAFCTRAGRRPRAGRNRPPTSAYPGTTPWHRIVRCLVDGQETYFDAAARLRETAHHQRKLLADFYMFAWRARCRRFHQPNRQITSDVTDSNVGAVRSERLDHTFDLRSDGKLDDECVVLLQRVDRRRRGDRPACCWSG